MAAGAGQGAGAGVGTIRAGGLGNERNSARASLVAKESTSGSMQSICTVGNWFSVLVQAKGKLGKVQVGTRRTRRVVNFLNGQRDAMYVRSVPTRAAY